MATFVELTDRMHPMTVKELQQGMRRASFVYPFLGIHILAIAAMAMEFSSGSVTRTEYAGVMNLYMLMDSGPFWNVVGGMCGIIMPLGGLILMGQELEEGNHELLLLTKLDRWSVVKGKFFILWAVCALSFISLLPYVVLRYFIGGVELWQEFVCGLSVLGLSAVVCAGTIGASAYQHIGARIAVLVLFLLSFMGSASVVLFFSALITRDKSPVLFQTFFNANGLAIAFCYATLGLTMARSRLRLVVHAYEVKPSWLVIGLIIFTPFVVSMCTAVTIGFAGFVGLLGMSLVAIYMDVTPKLKSALPSYAGAIPAPALPPSTPPPA